GGCVGASVSTGIGGDGGLLVAGHYRSYGNWDSPDGEVFNSGFRDSGVLVRASYRLGAGALTAGPRAGREITGGKPPARGTTRPRCSSTIRRKTRAGSRSPGRASPSPVSRGSGSWACSTRTHRSRISDASRPRPP